MARRSGTAWSPHVAVALLIMVGVVMLHAGGATAELRSLEFCKNHPRSEDKFECPSVGITKRESNCNPVAGPLPEVSVQATNVPKNTVVNLRCKKNEEGENGGESVWYLVNQGEWINCYIDVANLKFAKVKCKRCTYPTTSSVTCPRNVCEFPEGVPSCS